MPANTHLARTATCLCCTRQVGTVLGQLRGCVSAFQAACLCVQRPFAAVCPVVWAAGAHAAGPMRTAILPTDPHAGSF